MKDYELEVCHALQHDLKVLGSEWDIDVIYNFWAEWSDMLAAGWLGYEQGDIKMLKNVIEIMGDKINKSN